MLKQISAVVMMNITSLPQRGLMTLVTLIAVAIVVAVLLAFLAMADGFKATVNNAGSNELGIALRAGSQAELNSGLTGEQAKLFAEAPGILTNEAGPIVSPELYVVVDGKKKGSDSSANISLRGMTLKGTAMRKQFVLAEGRMFDLGKNELIAGRSVAKDFAGFEVGNTIKLGQATWTVVGVFEAGGSVYESELWADAVMIQTQFQRGNSFQTFRFALEKPGDVSAIQAFIEDNPRLNLDVQTELSYFQSQAKELSNIIFYVGWPLAIIMALGALSGALNTMYTSVSQRTREIATLRSLGFGGASAFWGTLAESVVLAFLGGLLGTALAFFFFNGMTASTLGGNFTQVVFQFEMTASAFKQGVVLALGIGLLGGIFPAFRAARIPVLKAFGEDDS